MKRIIFLLTLTCSTLIPLSAQCANEIWAYLYKGEEKYFPTTSPITDVACFSASVDGDGRLTGGHVTPPSLPTQNLRYHLVVTIPWNTTLAHIYLNPELPLRDRIIADIVERSKGFDGVQIDFESIAAADATNYLRFLAAVKRSLPKDKLFSVAVMARWKEYRDANPTDAFDYASINMIADRVVVMAYDEHARGGAAGPIASLPWCRKIYAYAVQNIDSNKLIMGIPLYGRSWQKETTTSAFRNQEIWSDLNIRQVEATSSASTGGHYAYSTKVNIDVYFENLPSLNAKMELYKSPSTQGIAFWRIGQEPLNFWEEIPK